MEPRPLNAAERGVLAHLLSADFPHAAELRGQLDRTEVVGAWSARSVSVDLRVREPGRHTGLPSRLAPVGGEVHAPSGDYLGELLLWTDDDGRTLSALEYAWVTDEMPTALPAVERIRLV
ncbi:hypothetical protein [Streptomyces sp. TLI_171]|uniref:hypothetical protein n=1 Tax=Streptomyces sp. TLI_171 TaxID=1938859 RepID=UPI000C192B5D|nr:hypothetical protein [Streptomyces sp. TLI_171]RKE17932.1 hypothetical protein BX266_1203 [Streptomyces sp. TLI_171]